jgi:AraC-type transcriptional regulator N-terminus
VSPQRADFPKPVVRIGVDYRRSRAKHQTGHLHGTSERRTLPCRNSAPNWNPKILRGQLPQPAASPEKTHVGLGMAINPDRLKEALGRINLARPAIAPDRLLRLLDRPDDIPVMAPLIEQEILYRLLTGPCGPRLLQIATTQTQQDCSGHRLASGELQAASAHRRSARPFPLSRCAQAIILAMVQPRCSRL